jgi:hypothetical protein
MASMLSQMIGMILLVGAGPATWSASTALPAEPGSTAAFDPIAFFTGRTHGDGALDTLLSRPVKVTVESVGQRQGDTLTLDQTIREGDKPPRVRRWTMRRVAAGSYTGTLTDAVGPVQVTVTGPRASIKYRMRNGLRVDQQLTLQSDDRIVINLMRVQKLGVQVATLKETISKAE